MRAVAVVLTVGIALALAASGVAAAKPPKVVEVDYSESDDGSSPPKALDAFVRRAAAVRFRTRFDGRSARARAIYRPHITKPAYHGDASHPWRAPNGGGGKRVKRLIHQALTETGAATVRVIARGGERRVVERVVFVLSECTQDPPLYPLSCIVKP